MTVNERLRDAGVSHAVYLQRYKTQEVREVVALLNQMDRELFLRLERDGLGPVTRDRLEHQLADVQAITREAEAELRRRLSGDLEDFAGYEAEFQARRITEAVPVRLSLTAPAPAQVWAAATAQVYGDPKMSRLFADWLAEWGAAKTARIEGVLRRGFAEGQTVQQMVRTLRGTRARGYADGLLEIDRRGAAALVRTTVNHVSSVARGQTYRENEDIVAGEQWVATLDGRTTIICASLDGKVDLFDGSKRELNGVRPPAHWGCRSVTIPVLRSWREMGIDIAEAPAGTRASMNGQVAASIAFPAWLKGQPAGVQREVLGASRYEMFRSGTPIERFVDDGRVLTLAELKAKEAT